ncbi:hypothetical protein LTR62_008113 [Meristemomyces frigidus]|uniref:Alpha-L-arabinofuranosidase n=1 Tax=Meristemomyces frigidus TaxID=1508187 RepID=A0AAN7TB82_9PEZI|nr:hypothetical protein LTR62_008113 [Meristemomyces frigidus]
MASSTLSFAVGITAMAAVVNAFPQQWWSRSQGGPCDIYASGGTPCVAAHGTTRALYGNYNGALYQVKRSSDGQATDIHPRWTGGVANAETQDNFCSGTSCTITTIYDQSGHNNHLTPAPPGGAASGSGPNGYDLAASATAATVHLNGQKAYGVYVTPGIGYRNDQTSGVATGDAAEGIYAVVDGSHYNGGCCFDYGNAETNNNDDGAGTMEALYFGLGTGYGTGAGSGPWILADMENGLFSENVVAANQNDPTQTSRFVTGILKGEAGNWSLRGGNSASGGLSTYWSGARPAGYNPMKKQGAIILGIGGDNSNGAQGTFYEGVMTTGYPSDQTENSVQANIVAARYST